MSKEHKLDDKFETIAWGALLIWWGLRWWLLLNLPEGSGLLGTGLILLGLNAARSLKGIPTRRFTTILAIYALAWGGLEMANSVLNLPFKLPAFEILLIVSGMILLAGVLFQGGHKDIKDPG